MVLIIKALIQMTIIDVFVKERQLDLQKVWNTTINSSIIAFFAVNLIFYGVEHAIWGHGFYHCGDNMLLAILCVNAIYKMALAFKLKFYLSDKGILSI